MAGIDERQGAEAPESREPPDWSDLIHDQSDLESLVRDLAMDDRLAALIATACAAAVEDFPLIDDDPDHPPHPGVQAAVEAYRAWKHAGESVPAPMVLRPGHGDLSDIESDIVPLSAVGRWVAWSSDGLRILAIADTIAEAERLAAEVGEMEPILERPPAPHHL